MLNLNTIIVKRFLLTGFLCLLAVSSFSTCIAIYVAKDGNIYVAADSRRTFIFKQSKSPDKAEVICKIHNVGNNYFAISGFDDGGLLKAANIALKQNTNIDTAIKAFGDAMSKRYRRLMDEARMFYPEKFINFLSDGLANVSFFGFYDGIPNIVNIEFFCYLDDRNAVAITYRIRQKFAVTVIGISKDITSARADELPTTETMEQAPQLYVEALVKIEAKKHPDAVSEPIDLLELKPTGATWLRKNEKAVAY